MARPSKYTAALAADICARLASGESLSSICEGEDKPGLSTVYRWLQDNAEFRDLYARAREDQADTLADQVLKIADEDPAVVERNEDGAMTVLLDSAAIQRQKLRIDARKWVASKLKPKKYGDRIEQEITVTPGTVSAEPLGPDEWQEQYGQPVAH